MLKIPTSKHIHLMNCSNCNMLTIIKTSLSDHPFFYIQICQIDALFIIEDEFNVSII